MLQGDARDIGISTKDDPELPNIDNAVLADLAACRREYEELQREYERGLQTQNEGKYRLGARIVGLSLRLQDEVAWQAFVGSPNWLKRKRPKLREQEKAVRHAVRFVLPPESSRQVRNYWTLSLEGLIAEGVAETEIAVTLRKRGGFEAICKARPRAKSIRSDDKRPNGVRLFKKPSRILPKVLQETIIVGQEGGQVWVEDGNNRTLLFLAMPSSFRARLQPGELYISATVGKDDLSSLEVTELELENPTSLLQLRHKPTTPDGRQTR
jgi:hypothetical protein